MEVNKKRLSEIFGVSVRTIKNWQDQGMPVARGGGKGNEVLYESSAAIEWYSARDAAIENEKLRKEVEDLRLASESDLQPGTIDYERHRLTRAQADAQELKNAKDSAEVVETAFCTFVLSRISVPERVAYLTAGIDSQLDRYEMRVWGWGPGEESWLIDRQIIMGRHDDEATLVRVDEAINKTYLRKNGVAMSVSRICWDIGGIDPTIVYNRSKKHGLFRVIPIKGASVYGKPVANMPRKRNKNGVYLTEVGTDTAKEQIYNRFTLQPEGGDPLAGAVHFPNNPEIYDLAEAQQLTAEEQVEKWVDGRKKIVWDSKKRRNEALDCFVYALAALRISISRWQLNLDSLLASLLEEEGNRTNNKTLADYARALSGDE